MSTRIEIELTSTSPDGSWTWRAAGAREPRGVLAGTILPDGAKVGDTVRVEVEQGLDGIHVLSVVAAKERSTRTDLLELLPTESTFEPVTQQRARRERGGDRDDRRDRRRDRGDRRDRPDRGERRDRDDRRPGGPRDGRGDRDRGPRGERPERRSRPFFTPPAELPQRPKPKRLRPAKEHRAEVLASLPEEQRPIAELTLQGIKAVRQRLRDDNARLRREGKPEMPEAAVMKMAEELLPRLRVAEWMDRAVAAKRQLAHLDLRDLRSVVVAADDPLVTRDESTRELAAELKQALVTKQDEEQALWLADLEAAVEVGRVVRALRLSSQPPKAGVPFPSALAHRLGEVTTASLLATDPPERWIAVLEAAAFSPVRAHVAPASPPEHRSPELDATVTRLGPLLPQVAALFGIEVDTNAPPPKPLRMPPRKPDKGKDRSEARRRGPDRPAPTPEAEREVETSPRPPTEAETEPAQLDGVAPTAEAARAQGETEVSERSAPSDEAEPAEAAAPGPHEQAAPGAGEPGTDDAPSPDPAPEGEIVASERSAPSDEAEPAETTGPAPHEPAAPGAGEPGTDEAPSPEADPSPATEATQATEATAGEPAPNADGDPVPEGG